MKSFLLAITCLLVCSIASAATLYVTEFQGAPPLSVYYQAVTTPALANQTVSIGGSSAQSSAFSSTTGIVRINTDTTCRVLFGTNPTALSTSMRMIAGQTEYFIVTPGQKVAVITGT